MGVKMKNSNKLLVVIISLIISVTCFSAFISAYVTKSDAGSELKLRIEYSAEQDGDKAVVTASLYLDYQTLRVDYRKNNMLVLDGKILNFDTPDYYYDSPGSVLLAESKAEYTRLQGESISVSCQASWDVDGDGSGADNLTVSSEFILNDEAVKKATSDTGASDTASETDTKDTDNTYGTDTTTGVVTTAAETASVTTFGGDTTAEQTTAEQTTADVTTAPETYQTFSQRYELSSSKGPVSLRVVVDARDGAVRGTAEVTAVLYMDHHSISMGERQKCEFTVGSKTEEFTAPAMDVEEEIPQTTYITTITTEANIGDTIRVYANIPYNGEYANTVIDAFKLDEMITLK